MANSVLEEVRGIAEGQRASDFQSDVLDSETPSLEGELDVSRQQEEVEFIDALQALRELQQADPIRWKVWRVNSEDRRRNGFLCEWTTSELTQENLAKHWGGGTYRVRGTFTNGKYAGMRTITIGADVKPLEPANVMPQSPNSSGFDMQAFLAMQAAADSKREERARQDRKDFLTLALPIMGQIAEALLSRAAPAQPDVAGLITALRPTVAPPDPMDSMKKMFEIMALSQKMNGGGSRDGDSLASLLTAAAPYAQPLLSAFANRQSPVQVRQVPRTTRAGAPPNQSTVAATAPIPAASVVLPMDSPSAPGMASTQTGVDLNAPSQPMTQDQQAMMKQLKEQTDALVQMAEQGADPLETANFFWDNVIPAMTDDQYSALADFIARPNAISQLSIFNTGVKTHVTFFETFQKRVVELIQQADQEPQN